MPSFLKHGLAAMVAYGIAAAAGQAETIKIAFIDPLSGPFASVGVSAVNQFRFAGEELVNKRGGVLGGQEFEFVAFDNQGSPKESLIQLQVAIDQGMRYIVQGASSGVAHALTDAIGKHNQRNPDKRVLYLNYAAVDPALTNDKCSFWHFRFDAHVGIKMDAMTDVIAADSTVGNVYVIGQDYSFGKAVAVAITDLLGKKRPDINIVGNELHPIGKVKDFTPYSRKIIAAETDAIVTGNWGADMLGLGKSVVANGYDGPIYTFYGAANGITAAFGEHGKDRVRMVAEGQLNPPASDRAREYNAAYRKKHPEDDLSQPRITNIVSMLARAIEEAGSWTDVVAVANSLEGMEQESMFGGKVFMRPQDHQLIQDVHIHVHTDEGITFDFDNSGYGLYVENTVAMAGQDSHTTCRMQRP